MQPQGPQSTRRATIRFMLPPSLGTTAALRAQPLESYLNNRSSRPYEVILSTTYEAVAKDLLSGRADAAWAPPFVCARVESMGARVAVRTVRRGASSFRSALLCREDKPLRLEDLVGKRAMWVDPDSVGGYLLPVAFLKAKGLDLAKAFFSQDFARSYRAALEAVAEGRADVAAIFAPANAPEGVSGLSEIAPDLESRFRVIAMTDEAPNDGVATSPSSDPEALLELERLLLTLHESADGRVVLKTIFNADAFEPAPRMGYRALYRVALSTL